MNNIKSFLVRFKIILIVSMVLGIVSVGVLIYLNRSNNSQALVSPPVGTENQPAEEIVNLTVNGIAKRAVTSDKIIWDINYRYYVGYPGDYDKGYDIPSAIVDTFMDKQTELVQKEQNDFQNYLIESGVSKEDIKIGKLNIDGFDYPPFSFSSIITVESNDVDLIEEVIDDMSRVKDFKANFYTKSKRYYYTLGEVAKNILIDEAVKDAGAKVDKAALIQGKKVIKIDTILPGIINIIPAKDTVKISLFENTNNFYNQEDDDTAKEKIILMAVPVVFQTSVKIKEGVGSLPIPNIVEVKLDPVNSSDHIRGLINAPISIIEYGDTSCPPCKDFYNTMEDTMRVFAVDNKINWVYRSLLFHPSSELEAEGLECAANIGGNDIFWKYLGKVYEAASSNRGNRDVDNIDTTEREGLSKQQLVDIAHELYIPSAKFNKCISDGVFKLKVNNESKTAVKNGVDGAPTVIIALDKPLSDKAVEFMDGFNKKQFKYLSKNIVLISPDKMKIKIDAVIDFKSMDCILNAILGGKQSFICR